MTKKDIIGGCERMLGMVPGFIEQSPESWSVPMFGMMGEFFIGDSAIPLKYKALIAHSTAAFLHGRYTSYASAEFARAVGCSDEEIQEASAEAGNTALFSTWLNGTNYDLSTFEREWRQMLDQLDETRGSSAPEKLTSREEILKDIQNMFGIVPGWLNVLPEIHLKYFWQLFRNIDIKDALISSKNKSLISLAVASTIPCRYCMVADSESARSSGASEDEIREAVLISSIVNNFETIMNGMRYDPETFIYEIDKMIDSMRVSAGPPV